MNNVIMIILILILMIILILMETSLLNTYGNFFVDILSFHHHLLQVF